MSETTIEHFASYGERMFTLCAFEDVAFEVCCEFRDEGLTFDDAKEVARLIVKKQYGWDDARLDGELNAVGGWFQ